MKRRVVIEELLKGSNIEILRKPYLGDLARPELEICTESTGRLSPAYSKQKDDGGVDLDIHNKSGRRCIDLDPVRA